MLTLGKLGAMQVAAYVFETTHIVYLE